MVLLFPEVPTYMFGADEAPANIDIENPLRIFSLLLVPFAVTLVMRFLFQILEHRILSLVMSAGQLAGMITCLYCYGLLPAFALTPLESIVMIINVIPFKT